MTPQFEGSHISRGRTFCSTSPENVSTLTGEICLHKTVFIQLFLLMPDEFQLALKEIWVWSQPLRSQINFWGCKILGSIWTPFSSQNYETFASLGFCGFHSTFKSVDSNPVCFSIAITQKSKQIAMKKFFPIQLTVWEQCFGIIQFCRTLRGILGAAVLKLNQIKE